jgi:HEPN superfamily RiboL-PSP-like protein
VIDCLHKFQGRVKLLISFLDDAEAINALARDMMLDDDKSAGNADISANLVRLRANNLDRRIQTYVSGIILLYGVFEQYVEEMLTAYLEEINETISSFDDIPKKIKENHTNLSAQLLMNRGLDKYRDRCDEADIVQRMHSCMHGGPFRINTLAFTNHKSNFRIKSLNKFFETAGIGGMSGRLKKTIAFQEYNNSKNPSQRSENLLDTIVFEDLDDLAWRRNVVAHGWPDQTLSTGMMKERVEYIRVLGECIYEALRQILLPHIIKHQCFALPKPLSVFNKSIVCFHLEAGSVVKGSQIIASRPGGFLEGKILSIEINHVKKVEVAAPPAVDVALLVDFKAKHNFKYFARMAEKGNGSGFNRG